MVKTGEEQGVTAARMLLKAMQGTPVDQIPIEVNKFGKRYINVTVLKKMGLNQNLSCFKAQSLSGRRNKRDQNTIKHPMRYDGSALFFSE